MADFLTDFQASMAGIAPGGVWLGENTSQPFATNSDGSIKPFVVWTRIVSTDNVTLSGPTALQNTRVQVDIFASRLSDAEAVRQAADAAIYAAFSVVPLSSQDVYESATKLYRIIREYSVWYDDTAPLTLKFSQNGAFIDPYTKSTFQPRGWNFGFWGSAVEDDFIAAKAQGANFIRMPLRWWGYHQGVTYMEARSDGHPGNIDPAHLVLLDQYMAWASKHKLWVDLYLGTECGKNGAQSDDPGVQDYCDPQGLYPNGRNLWSDPTQRVPYHECIAFLVQRYAQMPYFGCIEPLVEADPDQTTFSSADIDAFYQEVYGVIRAVHPTIPILIGGRSYQAFAMQQVYQAWYTNVIYAADLFWQPNATPDPLTDYQNRIAQCVAQHQAANVPVLLQQVLVRSADDDSSFTNTHAVLTALNQSGLGWMWWEYRGHSANGPEPYWTNDLVTWTLKADQLAAITSHFTTSTSL